jgi:hypothetical protein
VLAEAEHRLAKLVLTANFQEQELIQLLLLEAVGEDMVLLTLLLPDPIPEMDSLEVLVEVAVTTTALMQLVV